MEDTSPGLSFRSSVVLMVVAAWIAVLTSVIPPVSANDHRHRNRHGHHKPEAYSNYYEDSAVIMPPEFLDTRQNVTAVVGSEVRLPCTVKYLGTKQVAWRRIEEKKSPVLTVGDFTWVRNKNYKVDVEYGPEPGQISHWDLVISSVNMSYQGLYQCQVTSKKPLRTHVYLTVKKQPPMREPSVKIIGKEFVDRNDKIELKCNATGGPRIPVEIDWFKDGTKIDSNTPRFLHVTLNKYSEFTDEAFISTLIIDKADEKDSGTYICRSSDKKITSHRVTVLVADTTNVKRGTGSNKNSEDSQEKTHTRTRGSLQTSDGRGRGGGGGGGGPSSGAASCRCCRDTLWLSVLITTLATVVACYRSL